MNKLVDKSFTNKTDSEKIIEITEDVGNMIVRGIERLVKKYPNDMELGQEIRKLFEPNEML